MKPLLICLLAGLVSACGFEPLGLWPALLAALVVLLGLVVRAPTLRSALARGWWFGVGHFTLGLNWIATSFTYQANMPAWLGWIAVVLLALYLAVYPAIAAGLAWRHGRSDPAKFVLIFAAAWTLSEWLRAALFTGFAWNPLGVALLPTSVARLAAWVGTYGLSAVALLIAGAVALLLVRERRAALLLLGAIGGATLLAAALAGGAPQPRPIALRIVQPNIGQEDKWQEGSAERHLQRLALMSGYPGDEPRLLLWPEAAVTSPLEDGRPDPFYRARALQLQRALARLLGPRDLLLTGGVTLRSTDGIDATSATNSIFAIGRAGVIARYDKAHLVPYGEYLPMRPFLSALGLSRLAPGDVDFDPGPGPQTIALPLVGKVGFQLCYEIIFSGEVVERGNRPAFLFNPSNDAWFGGWGPPQHIAQARLRAIEEGLPVLRSTPTGISAVIDADGRLLNSLGWRQAGVIDTLLPAPRPPTLFARFGNVLPLLLALLLAAAAIAVRRKQR